MKGQEVARLVEGAMTAGEHQARFDAANLPSGVYIVQLQSDAFNQQSKAVLLR